MDAEGQAAENPEPEAIQLTILHTGGFEDTIQAQCRNNGQHAFHKKRLDCFADLRANRRQIDVKNQISKLRLARCKLPKIIQIQLAAIHRAAHQRFSVSKVITQIEKSKKVAAIPEIKDCSN